MVLGYGGTVTGQQKNPIDLAQDIMRVVEGSENATTQYSLRIAGIMAEYESLTRFQRENPTSASGQSHSAES
jgi:hypothetical protein